MSTKLASIGVNDSNAIKLKSALEKEFGVEFPARLFLPTSFVNEIVTHIALVVYKVDTSGSQVENSGPVNPELLKDQIQEQNETEKKEQATDRPVNSTAPSAGPKQSPSSAGKGK